MKKQIIVQKLLSSLQLAAILWRIKTRSLNNYSKELADSSGPSIIISPICTWLADKDRWILDDVNSLMGLFGNSNMFAFVRMGPIIDAATCCWWYRSQYSVSYVYKQIDVTALNCNILIMSD